ncbi:hypothetical protein [uncultured Hymenobacter sp.]|uniref:hypothetical protein n=1 Tax=uncultured Hymenobacter sp. TaxID=170016 RepID=UPI0035CC0B3E
MLKFTSSLLLVLLLTVARPPRAAAQLYDVRAGTVSHEKRERPALKVQVDGSANDTRSYFQDWMKDGYNVRFKGGGIAGLGKSTTLTAKQASVSTLSGKLVNLYATVIAPTDSTAEVALFGGLDDNTFFDETGSPTEYGAMRTLLQSFASAARPRAYRAAIDEAGKKLREAERDKEKLERNVQQRRASTVSNLKRIEDLKKENTQNKQQVSQDSVRLLQNVDVRRAADLRLQQRRARLSALGQKN